MKLYLLSCRNIQEYTQRILPLLPEQRRLAYDRSRSGLTLGAGLLLSQLLNVHMNEDVLFGPYGKPILSAGKAEFSLSHSYEHVLLGVSDKPIGVDMERKDRRIHEAVRQRMCLPQEKELDPLQIFTRKECAMKLTGLGFSLPLQEIDTTIDFRWQDKSYRFYTTEAEGYLISLLSADTILPEIQLLTVQELL